MTKDRARGPSTLAHNRLLRAAAIPKAKLGRLKLSPKRRAREDVYSQKGKQNRYLRSMEGGKWVEEWIGKREGKIYVDKAGDRKGRLAWGLGGSLGGAGELDGERP